jgi:hypothetical protein
VVLSKSKDDMSATTFGLNHDAPIVDRGSGTGPAGRTCNIDLVID